MNVRRVGLEYRFTPIKYERRTTKRTHDVPPDFQSRLSDLTGVQEGTEVLRDLMEQMGLELDTKTRLTLDPNSGLVIETDSSADVAAVEALVQNIAEHRPIQHKFTSWVINLPADTDWTPPDLARLDSDQHSRFMMEMMKRKGTDIMTLPSIAMKNGQTGNLEIIHEIMVPTDEAGTAFEAQEFGQNMDLQGNALGFGNELAINYTHTTCDFDQANGRPVINNHTEVKDTGFSSNNGTRFAVQTRPNGSRAIVLVSPSRIDAAGYPME